MDEIREDIESGNVWPDDRFDAPLTDLEFDLLRSLDYEFGKAGGRIVELPPRRWS